MIPLPYRDFCRFGSTNLPAAILANISESSHDGIMLKREGTVKSFHTLGEIFRAFG